MATFEITRETLHKVEGLQHLYEEQLIREGFDDNTVFNCISDPILWDQLNVVIPKGANFAKFVSKFKELYKIKNETSSSKIFKSETIQSEDKSNSKHDTPDTNVQITNSENVVIPLPPPLPPPENVTDLMNSMSKVFLHPKNMLAEIMQRQQKLTPLAVAADPDDEGFIEDEAENKPPSTTNNKQSTDDLVNEMKRTLSKGGQNRQDVLKKIEETQLTKKISAAKPELDAELANDFLQRQSRISSVDIDVMISAKNENTNKSELVTDAKTTSSSHIKLRRSKSSKPIIKEESSEQNELIKKLARRNSINNGETPPEIRNRIAKDLVSDSSCIRNSSSGNIESPEEGAESIVIEPRLNPKNYRRSKSNSLSDEKLTSELGNKLHLRRMSLREDLIAPSFGIQEVSGLGEIYSTSKIDTVAPISILTIPVHKRPPPPIKPRRKPERSPVGLPPISEKMPSEIIMQSIDTSVNISQNFTAKDSSNSIPIIDKKLEVPIVVGAQNGPIVMDIQELTMSVQPAPSPAPCPLPAPAPPPAPAPSSVLSSITPTSLVKFRTSDSPRSDLLQAIRQGIELKRADPTASTSKNRLPGSLQSLVRAITKRRDVIADSSDSENHNSSEEEENTWEED